MSNSSSRLGAPIELPWWVLPLSLPPALVLLGGLLVPEAWPARVAAVLPAAALIVAIVRVARSSQSPNLQSVWISTAYGLWASFPIAWVALLLSPPH